METLFLKLIKSLLNFTLVHLYIYRKTGIKIANRILKQYTSSVSYENVRFFADDDYLGDNTWN